MVPHKAIGTMASDITPERLDLLSPGRLAVGKVTMLDGDPGLGKSTLSLDWAARITRGEPLPGGQRRPPRGVVVLSAEDGEADTIVPRLMAANADLSRVFLMDSMEMEVDRKGVVTYEEVPVTLPHGVTAIEDAISRHDAALLIVDPLVAFFAGDAKANNDQDMRRALKELTPMLNRKRCAGLFLRHLNKAADVKPLYRGGGSIGIIGAARFGLLVARDPEDDSACIVASTKSNLGPMAPALRYRLVGVPGTDVAHVEWDPQPVHVTPERLLDTNSMSVFDRAKQLLLKSLKDGPCSATEMENTARRAGISDSTLKRAKSVLGVQSAKLGNGWVWSLADQQPESSHSPHEPYDTLGPLEPLEPIDTELPGLEEGQEDQEDQGCHPIQVGPGSLWVVPSPFPPARQESVPSDCGLPHRCEILGRCPHYSDAGCPLAPATAPEQLEAAS